VLLIFQILSPCALDLLALFEGDIHYWRVLLGYYTLSHAIDEDLPHWRRSRRFQTPDLGLHCIF
jgi:hypothetical protein